MFLHCYFVQPCAILNVDAPLYDAWNAVASFTVYESWSIPDVPPEPRRLIMWVERRAISTKPASGAEGEIAERPLTRQQVEVQQTGAGRRCSCVVL